VTGGDVTGVDEVPGALIERTVTSGTFSLDGGTWDVDNNVWLVGDAEGLVVIDPAHDTEAILAAIGGRPISAIVATHGHDDHISAALAVADTVGAPVWLHPSDRMLWDRVYPDRAPDRELRDGTVFTVGGTELRALHTPGHSPGSTCLHLPEAAVVFSGDTLFNGGPGATGRSFSSFDQIVGSITTRLLTLPPETVVHTGHGDDTSIGLEAPQRQAWLDQAPT
jgi:glyoxylase-like metal-dependent hydrolase (beta-lactamase superfamily II)